MPDKAPEAAPSEDRASVATEVARSNRRRRLLSSAALLVLIGGVAVVTLSEEVRSFAEARMRDLIGPDYEGTVPFRLIRPPRSDPQPHYEPPTEQIAGPEIPDCTADQVALELQDRSDRERPIEWVEAILYVKPRSEDVMCGWSRDARLAVVDPDGDRLEVALRGRMKEGRILLYGAERARTGLSWSSLCDPTFGRPAELEVSLADGSTLVDGPRAVTQECERRDPLQLRAEHWYYKVPVRPEGPLDTLESAIVEAPERATVGEDLRYVVEVRNPTEEDVALDPCPVVFSSFGESGTADFLRTLLNCEEAPPEIPAGGTVRFEMRIRVSRAVFLAGPGGNSLFWSMSSEDGTTNAYGGIIPIVRDGSD